MLSTACHLERQRSRPILSRIKNTQTKSVQNKPSVTNKTKPTYSLVDKFTR